MVTPSPGPWRPCFRFAGISLLGAALAACGNSGSSPQAGATAAPGAPAVPVLAAVAEQRSVPVQLQGVGNVETVATVAVKSRVDGQIVKVHFKDGDPITRGQLLFEIDPRPFEAQLNQAQANLLRNQAQLDYALGQERRYLDLLDKNFVSREAYAQVRSNLETAQAAVAADRAAIESARLQLQYATIRAPLGGRAGKVLVTEGNLVQANDSQPLVVINQLSPIYVSFAVAEHFGPRIRAAMGDRPLPVTVTVAGKVVQGELAFVDNAVDASTGTLRLRAQFGNENHLLWPGDFVEAVLTLGEERDALVIPAAAVLTGPKGTYTFVIKEDQSVEQRPIRVSRSEGDIAVVDAGVRPGERVVTDGASRLTGGAKVSVKSAPGGS